VALPDGGALLEELLPLLGLPRASDARIASSLRPGSARVPSY
jgi:hypothetical protein